MFLETLEYVTEKEFLDELAIEYERQKEIKIKEGKIELNDKG